MGSEILGATAAARWRANKVCCYGWVDVAYIPRSSHAAFRAAARAFWRVQLEVCSAN